MTACAHTYYYTSMYTSVLYTYNIYVHVLFTLSSVMRFIEGPFVCTVLRSVINLCTRGGVFLFYRVLFLPEFLENIF